MTMRGFARCMTCGSNRHNSNDCDQIHDAQRIIEDLSDQLAILNAELVGRDDEDAKRANHPWWKRLLG